MTKFSRFTAAIALVFGLALPAQAAPALWKVSDADSSIWLFGSVHVLPESAIWRTKLFDDTLNNADKVYFETDVGPDAQIELSVMGMTRGIYTDGTLLTSVLGAPEQKVLRKVAKQLNVPIGSLLAMRPWLAANTISVAAILAEGYSAQGVDMVVQDELPDTRKGYFETGAEQLEFIAGAPEAEQIAMLGSTLNEVDQLPEMMDQMFAAWLAGEPDELIELFMAELAGPNKAFMERLIYERNQNWMTPIKTMLADNEAALVIVGAGHLMGERSVVDLLEKDGFAVERIQ